MSEFPILRYLKVNRETKPKRDFLEPEEFTELRKWMTHKWCREKNIDDLERLKRDFSVEFDNAPKSLRIRGGGDKYDKKVSGKKRLLTRKEHSSRKNCFLLLLGATFQW